MTKKTEQAALQQKLWMLILTICSMLIICGSSRSVSAQWTTPDANNNISNTNTGNVGVAVSTSTPESKLTVGPNTVGFPGQTTSVGIVSTLPGNSYDRALFVAPRQAAGASGNSVLIYGYPRINPGVTQPYQYGIMIDTNQDTGTITHYYPAVFMGGYVGIGTYQPQNILDVVDNKAGNSLARFVNSNSSGSTSMRLGTNAISTPTTYVNYELMDTQYWLGSIAADRQRGLRLRTGVNSTSESALTDQLVISPGGSVGIGTSSPSSSVKLDVAGHVNVSGNIVASGSVTSSYQDVAEWVPSAQSIPAATVVILDPNKANQVLPSAQAYDTRVAGVVSTRPGIVLGQAGENKVLVATTGRVKVRVDATRSPIHIGDLLVTSDKEGMAMKSEPINIGGVQIHRPGTLIGKALESLEGGTGEILILLSLQ